MDGRARGYQHHVPAGCLHRQGAGHGDADTYANTGDADTNAAAKANAHAKAAAHAVPSSVIGRFRPD
jgi:hypothetical protein